MQHTILLAAATLLASANAYKLTYYLGPNCGGEFLYTSKSLSETNKCYPTVLDSLAGQATSLEVVPEAQDSATSFLWFHKPHDCTQNPVFQTEEKSQMTRPQQKCVDFYEFDANSWMIHGPKPS